MKLNQKPEGKQADILSEENEEENIDRTLSIKTRSSKLDERLAKIVDSLEKERELEIKCPILLLQQSLTMRVLCLLR